MSRDYLLDCMAWGAARGTDLPWLVFTCVLALPIVTWMFILGVCVEASRWAQWKITGRYPPRE